METIFFYEKQSFRKNWIFMLALFSCLTMFGLMLYGLISQVFYGVPFGTHPISNAGMWMLAASVTILSFGIPWLVYESKLTIRVTEEGFLFRYFPFQISYRKIDLAAVEKYEINEFNPFSDYGGWGIRKKLLKKETAYIVSGSKGIKFTFRDGKIIVVGTQKPEELLASIGKIRK